MLIAYAEFGLSRQIVLEICDKVNYQLPLILTALLHIA